MSFDDYYYAPEMNDMSMQGFSDVSDSTLKNATEASESGSGSAGGSAAGGAAAGIAGVIPAVVVVTAVVSVIAAMTLLAPKVSAVNWQITHEMISFVLEVEETENPYIISLLSEGKLLEEFTLGDDYVVTFTDLEAETSYKIEVSNDYGGISDVVATYNIVTAGTPIYPEGTLRVSSHEINYQTKELKVNFELIDSGNYLTNLEVIITDGISEEIVKITDINSELVLDISQYNRGYITLYLKAKSNHPSSDGNLKNVSIYKIYY